MAGDLSQVQNDVQIGKSEIAVCQTPKKTLLIQSENNFVVLLTVNGMHIIRSDVRNHLAGDVPGMHQLHTRRHHTSISDQALD